MITSSTPPKGMLPVVLLDILLNNTDEKHRLSQKDIIDILKNEYSITVDRKTVRRNIAELIDCGIGIEYQKDVSRKRTDPETGNESESAVFSDIYLEHDFTDPELRLLIDSLLFSKNIPATQKKRLIAKLGGLSNRYFEPRIRHVRAITDTVGKNGQLFYTIEVLDEAIRKKRQVSFTYCEYRTDKRLHPRIAADGNERTYVINPYQIALTEGRCYLICNYDKYDDVANYRLDRIRDIKMLDTPVKPYKSVRGLEHGFDLPRHMAEHIYMYTGESAAVTFRFNKRILNELFDWFGGGIDFFDETEDEASARVTVNIEAMRKWGVQYALNARVISPASLVQDIKHDLEAGLANYGDAK